MVEGARRKMDSLPLRHVFCSGYTSGNEIAVQLETFSLAFPFQQ